MVRAVYLTMFYADSMVVAMSYELYYAIRIMLLTSNCVEGSSEGRQTISFLVTGDVIS